VLPHQPNLDTPVKLELASATIETPAQLVPKVALVNQEPMVPTVTTVSKATMVYPVICHQCHWTPLANVFHAHMDRKDPTDQKAQMVLQDQKDPTAKVVRQAQMAKLDPTVMQDQPDPMENLVNQDPKVTKELMEPKANQDQLAPRETKDQPYQLDQQAQAAKMPKLELMANQETKDPTAKEVNLDQKDHQAPTANLEAQAKMPPIALAQDEARPTKPEIQISLLLCSAAVLRPVLIVSQI